ncbi:MAG: monovalent cation/H+ antiporter complex subunit F [Devosia sp.]
MTEAQAIDLATTLSFAMLGVAVLATLIRILRGPTLADRILGLDMLNILGVGLIAVFAVRAGYYLYVDIAVALALVGFLSTAAFARYLLSRDEP